MARFCSLEVWNDFGQCIKSEACAVFLWLEAAAVLSKMIEKFMNQAPLSSCFVVFCFSEFLVLVPYGCS